MDECESVRITVFEVLQRFIEHHAVHASVAIDQGEFGFCLLF